MSERGSGSGKCRRRGARYFALDLSAWIFLAFCLEIAERIIVLERLGVHEAHRVPARVLTPRFATGRVRHLRYESKEVGRLRADVGLPI